MSVVHSIEFTPPIVHPERFAIWSRDVQKVLDYLPRYVAAGRKQRIFALSWEALPWENGCPVAISTDTFYAFHAKYHLEPLILPNQA